MLGCGAESAARLQSRCFGHHAPRLSATNSTPACSRPSASMWCSAANTSGSTRTTPSTSACWAIRPSPSPSTGTTPRSRAMRCMSRFRLSTASAPTRSCLRWLRASSRRRWPAPELPAGQGGYPFRIDHDEKFNQTTHVQYTVSRDGSWIEWSVGRLQLALRLRPGGGLGALLQRHRPQQPLQSVNGDASITDRRPAGRRSERPHG